MPMSTYASRLRACVGHDLLLSPAVAACIRDSQGRILLLRRAGGGNLWGFPGGMMEPGERADQALFREVLEETNLQVKPVRLIGVYTDPAYIFSYPNGDQVQPVTIFLECHIVDGKLRPDGEENVDARFFGPDETLPTMHPCCVAKAQDAFTIQDQAFFR